MAIRLASHLHQNRFGVFYFRQAIPADLTRFFIAKEIYLSLHTRRSRLAALVSVRLAASCRVLFEEIRTMTADKDDGLSPEDEQSIEQIAADHLKALREIRVPRTPFERMLDERRRHAFLMEKVEELEQQRVVSEERHRRDIALLQSVGRDPTTAVPATAASPRISELFAKFCLAKRRAKAWKDPEQTEKYDYGPFVRHLIQLVGDKPVGELTAEDAQRYAESVLVREQERTGNKDKRLSRIKALFRWAVRKLYMAHDFAGVLKLDTAGPVNEHYEPFTVAEMQQLFESPEYVNHRFKKASHFWIPLIGAYTGARINEIAQLYLSDIKEVDGLPAIDINDEDLKTVKNASSIRTVPIHPILIGLGFLDYVKIVAGEGHKRLFPELRKSARAKDSFGKGPSRDFTKYRRQCGVSPEVDRVKVFHSFRHTANNELRRRGVPQEMRERLVGHCSEGINNRTYAPKDVNERFPFQALYDELCKLNYGLKHPHYMPTSAHVQARRKASANASLATGGPSI